MFRQATITIGLLPIMFGTETGTRIMKRIAAPMVGGEREFYNYIRYCSEEELLVADDILKLWWILLLV